MLPFSPQAKTVMALAAITATLGTGHGYAAGGFNPLVGLALAVVMLVSLFMGDALCRLLELQETDCVELLHALLLGMVAVSTLLMLLGLTSPLSISGNFVVVCLVAAGLHVLAKRRCSSTESGALQLPRADGAGLVTLGMALFASVCWSVENLKGIRLVSPDTYEAYPWQDMFAHAKNVGRFMGPGGASSLGNEQLLGLPLHVYHYGSFFIPAFAGRVSGAQAYSLATSLLPMIGMFWTGMAAYALGRRCAGSMAGAAAAFGVLLVPDPSFMGLGNSWSGYFFFQQVGVGGMYGVAIMGLAAAHGLAAVQTGAWKPLLSATVLMAVAGLYKVQIVLVYSLPLLLLVLCFYRKHHNRLSLAAMATAVLVYAALVTALHRIPQAPTIGFTTEAALYNVRQIVKCFPAPVASWLLPYFPEGSSYLHTLALGVPLVLVATYGLWLAVMVLLLALRRLDLPAGARSVDISFTMSFCLMAIACHLVVAFAVAPNMSGYGDAFEIIHKTFVWPYFVVVTMCCVTASMWISACLPAAHEVPAGVRRASLALVALGAAATLVAAPVTQSSIVFSAGAMRLKMSRDYYEMASYLRHNTAPGAIVQYSANDPYLMLTALSERDSYVIQCMINCGSPHPALSGRVEKLTAVLQQTDIASVRSNARALGIDWLVVEGGMRPWQTASGTAKGAGADAVFGDLFVYSTRPRAG